MKKMLAVILVIVLAVSCLTVGVSADTYPFAIGDVNNDAVINAADALLVLRYTVNKVQFSREQFRAADVTGQNSPDAKDALCILQKTVGKLRHFDVEKTRILNERPEKGVYPDGLPYDDFWKDYYANGKGAYIGGAAYIRTRTELYEYTEDYGLSENYYPEQPHELLSVYSEEFFQDSSLILFYGLPKYSALPGTRVTDVYQVGKELCVEVLETLTEGEFLTTCDAHSNLYVVELKKNLADIDQLNFYVTYQKRWADENLTVTDILEEYQKSYQFYANYRKLTWQQPTENQRVSVVDKPEGFVVEICNTYEEFQRVLPREDPLYSEEYFEKGSLVLVTLTTPNTGYSYYAKEAYMMNGTLHMEWDMKTVGHGGHAEETWQYILEVEESLLTVDEVVCGVTKYDRDINGKETILKYYQMMTKLV